jgi:hypothetical protein
MAVVAIDLPANLPDDIAIEIAKRACYCDALIIGSRFIPESRQLEISCDNGTDMAAVSRKVELLVDKMKTERLAVKPKVIRSHQGKHDSLDTSVFDTLTKAGDIYTEGTGVISRGGAFLDLLERFDSLFARIGREIFHATPRTYNTLIPADWLRRAGYFSSFAHSITFAMHLCEDFHRLEQFAGRHKGGAELHFESLDEIATPEYCLSPAICYHTYGSMQESAFTAEDNGLRVYTAMGRCFRYESKNITALDRLWEFSMREIIFVGEKERVIEARQKAIELIWRLVEILDLHAELETASDPFFATDFRSLRFSEYFEYLFIMIRAGDGIRMSDFA